MLALEMNEYYGIQF